MFSPFPYSFDKERVGGSNDDKNIVLNGRDKVKIEEYYEFAH
jgi:hypothetical protein